MVHQKDELWLNVKMPKRVSSTLSAGIRGILRHPDKIVFMMNNQSVGKKQCLV